MRKIECRTVNWPAKGEFRISRSALTSFPLVQLQITENGHVGRAECRPYARYDETQETVILQIRSVQTEIENGISGIDLLDLMPAGAARNVIDCALWDLRAKQAGLPIWKLAGLPKPKPMKTAYTLSIDTPEKMAEAALAARQYSLLKVKVGDQNWFDACQAVLSARPDAKLIIDANEALKLADLEGFSKLEHNSNIALVEQPLPASQDCSGLFNSYQGPMICADESAHTHEGLQAIWDTGYRAVNVKLDKTGGFTEALEVMQQARTMGFKIMAGCMVGSSLAMAPMVTLASLADYIDLDGPLILAEDIEDGILYEGEILYPPSSKLWG